MAAEVEAVDGTVEKFAGDAVMAAFGAPKAHEDHAERALHAALAMQRRLREAVDPRLSLRIGVNTGDVVVDRPHEGSWFVTGDAVNVAARLEQAAEPDGPSSASARSPRREARSNSASSERSRPKARNRPSSAVPC